MSMNADMAKGSFSTCQGMGPLPAAPSEFPLCTAGASHTVLQIPQQRHTTALMDLPGYPLACGAWTGAASSQRYLGKLRESKIWELRFSLFHF